MKIIVTGSLGNISKPLTEILVKAGHDVTVISHDQAKADKITALGAKPAIGSLDDVAFMTETLTGADAAYLMIPPGYEAQDMYEVTTGIGEGYIKAIKDSGIKKIVFLSSIGSHHEGKTGPIKAIGVIERKLFELDGVDVKSLRPGFYFTNYLDNVDMVKNGGILGSNYPGNDTMVLTHPRDNARVAAEELQNGFTGKSYRYVATDERTNNEIAAALGKAIGKPALPWVEFNDEDNYKGMVQAGLPEEMSRQYTEMGAAVRSRILFEDFDKKKEFVKNGTKLEDFANEFAKAF
ncbi:NAD-dependent dehydratase [Mucilaginibacter hurinus]|uniref:NAD-dependent dehydratase n=1 Tax=Mucilaginibacter hurinus TaxID=2201324 RepID=A0A367GNS2_9SPHI|nr:NmrA family NAD(P)-binding protein [Mucilaginibacter hurinus]RCH54688.1 NAD-dependent dehydratase [Mucilaginibacter hurinus]